MDRETAKQEIRSRWRELITDITPEAKKKVKGQASYICPFCNHGAHGDGVTADPHSKDGNTLKCFSCGFSGDIIDLYMQTQKIDYKQAFSLLADKLGITVDPYTPTENAAAGRRSDLNAQAYTNTQVDEKNAAQAEFDYTNYYLECRERLTMPEAVNYLNGRGISLATAQKYYLGYDPKADPARSGHPSPRIIIPTNKGHYVARATTQVDAAYKAMNPKDSKPGIFNIKVLQVDEVQEVFICEGAFDALSVLEVGANAIALNSTANADKFIKYVEGHPTDKTFIVCLDNDKAGNKGKETIIAGLRRLNVSYITANISKSHKDPNECLQNDKAGFIEEIDKARLKTAPKPDNVQFYIDNLMGGELDAFKCDVKTGYTNIDKLSDGLYAGLYVLAAISSLGKTTFAHQMADQIAAAGTDVLYFSLEQSRLEMVTKSLARITGQNDLGAAVSSLSIRKGYIPQQVKAAAQTYKARVSDRMNIIEGNFGCDITFIGDYIRRYIKNNNAKPVVFIDYLQILQPGKDKIGRQQSTKEMIDIVVPELKRLSREFGITIVAICSINRKNYLLPVDFESLKESGIIEYTADVVWGLQLSCITDPIFQKGNDAEKRKIVKTAKESNPREVDLVCLKNRYGKASYDCNFKYYPACDLFIPEALPEPKKKTTQKVIRL